MGGVAAKKKPRTPATLEELFARVRERCETEYEAAFGKAWTGIDDWPQFTPPSDFERRARAVYEQLASAVEAARSLVDEHKHAVGEWTRETSTFSSAELLKNRPPAVATSTTAAKLAAWVGEADRAAEERRATGEMDGAELRTDISVRPWTETDPVGPRFLVAAHVLTLATFHVVPISVCGFADGVAIAPLSIATDREAAVMSLLHGNRPASTTKTWTVAKVIAGEAATMRLQLRRTVSRLVDVWGRMVEVGRIPEPATNTLEDAMLFAIAISKCHEVGASAFRLAEEQHPAQAAKLRETNPEGLAKMISAAEATVYRLHKGQTRR